MVIFFSNSRHIHDTYTISTYNSQRQLQPLINPTLNYTFQLTGYFSVLLVVGPLRLNIAQARRLLYWGNNF